MGLTNCDKRRKVVLTIDKTGKKLPTNTKEGKGEPTWSDVKGMFAFRKNRIWIFFFLANA